MEEEGVSLGESSSIGSVSSSFEKTSNPPESHVSFSQFGDSNCGEPLLSQHLVLDFSPGEADNDFVQRKCCAFWDYINSRKDVHNMMASPDTEMFSDNNDFITHDRQVSDSMLKPIEENRSTAISMLEFVEDKGLIDRIFEVKMKQSHCTLGSREYHECEPNKIKPKKKTTCTCTGTCTSCRNVPKARDPKARPPASAQVKTLCQKLQAWDADHPKPITTSKDIDGDPISPKTDYTDLTDHDTQSEIDLLENDSTSKLSMEPPGHPPALIHSVMQRKVE